MKSIITRFRLGLMLVSLAAVLGSMTIAASVVAQEEINFDAVKFNCERDPEAAGDALSFAGGLIPDYCTPVSGVEFEVALENGDVIGTCTTGESGFCSLAVPNEAIVVVTENVATGAPGYAPVENPITVQAVTEFANATFVNVPETTELPDTGTGTAEMSIGGPSAAAGLLGVLSVAFAVGAGITGRRSSR